MKPGVLSGKLAHKPSKRFDAKAKDRNPGGWNGRDPIITVSIPQTEQGLLPLSPSPVTRRIGRLDSQ